MMLLFSILYWTFFVVSALALFVVSAVVWLVTLPFDRNRVVYHLFAAAWGSLYIAANPLWRVRVEGTAAARRALRRQPCVIVSNHQSFVDILVLYRTFLYFKWVSKASIFRVPVIGWVLKLSEGVSIVRGDKESAARMGAACERWLERGASVLLFPEGTRSRDGRIHEFKRGAFRIARAAGAPVLPVVLDGTGAILPKHGWVLRERARVRVRVLEPIEVSSAASEEEAAERVRARMIEELGRMRGGAAEARERVGG